MKPFDLEKALAGEPVVTRGGKSVRIAGYSPHVKEDTQVIGWLNDSTPYCWVIDGKYLLSKDNHNLDLFMAEKPKVKKEGWVNVYRNIYEDSGYDLGLLRITEQEAKEKAHENLVATVKIEWEEDAE